MVFNTLSIVKPIFFNNIREKSEAFNLAAYSNICLK